MDSPHLCAFQSTWPDVMRGGDDDLTWPHHDWQLDFADDDEGELFS